jgi:hypothetical protein
LASKRTTGRGSVGATFQLGGKFGVGRSGGIEKASLISLHVEAVNRRQELVAVAQMVLAELSVV